MKIFTIFAYFAIYSEPLCATYVSFGGGGSHVNNTGSQVAGSGSICQVLFYIYIRMLVAAAVDMLAVLMACWSGDP